MLTGIRIHGTLNGISRKAYDALKDFLNFDEIAYENGTITFEHHGYYFELEDFLAKVARVMEPGCKGYVDHIDNDAWEITRYVLERGRCKSKTISLNEVLEPYQYGLSTGTK
ncbi:MAG: hypothetical protein SVS15_04520, partial [Thermodesulfobacteriota bacterium]|nr:hypothetical protein [Thermodesulfobacteriota bacterium]